MRQIYRSLSVILLIAGFSVEYAVAQKDTTKLNQSVEVMKAYSPSISNANKINQLPVIDDTTRFTPEFKYSIDSQPVKSGFTASPIGAADVNGVRSKDLGLGYLKLSVGMYNTLYGDFFLNVPKSKIGTFGVHLRHLSSEGQIKLNEGDLVDAPYSQNNGGLFGSVILGSTILSGEISYDRDAMNYFGYPVALPANISMASSNQYGLNQAYQNGNFKITLKNSEKTMSDLNFNGGIRLGFFDALTGQKETSGGLFGKFDYNFDPYHGILDVSVDHFSTDSISIDSQLLPGTKTEDWIRIAPSVRLDGDNWSLRGGVNLVGVMNQNEANTFKLYPDFEFNFRPVKDILTLYAGFKGDLKQNRYGDIAKENYWADPRHNVRNTDYTYIISGGLKGKISPEISYNFGLKYSQVKDQYFYVTNSYHDYSSSNSNNIVYNNAFDLAYDNVGIFNLSTEFSYVSGKDLSIVLRGNYYNYNLESLPFAPQKPNFDLTASGSFRIIDRLTGFADFDVIGKRQAKTFYSSPAMTALSETKVFSIDPSIRINLGATYDYSSKLKLFGRVDNLLNRQNEQWLGYTSQGLRLMAGAAYSF